MTYNITYNSQFNSHEIYFDGKPSDAVRNALKELKFRWHGVKKCWYGFGQSEESLAAVITGTTTDEEPATVVADGYLGGGAVYGSKSNRYLHGSDLSAAIRADLKKAGIKNTTVKCKTYAGGQNVTATVKLSDSDYIPFEQFLNRYRVSCSGWIFTGAESIHADRYWSMDADEQEQIRQAAARHEYREIRSGKTVYHVDRIDYLTPEALDTVKLVDKIISAYRYDCSNSMVDYFDTNFYYDIDIKSI
jgi:hypothetical protein